MFQAPEVRGGVQDSEIKGSEGRSLKVFYELGFSEVRVPHYRSRCHDDFLLIFLPSILLCLFV